MAGGVTMVSLAYKDAAIRLARSAREVVDIWDAIPETDVAIDSDHPLHEAIERLAQALENAKLPTVQ